MVPKTGINFILLSKKISMNKNCQAVGGLLLTGTGLSMAVDAGTVRAKGGKWFLYGTLALIVFQAGLCLIADTARGKNTG